jgi:phosphatidylserine/phosphatidylglycerophosphate/cardiolipin synthase-like enzyme
MFDIHRLVLFRDKPGHRAKNNKKKLSNALENASHWASGKSTLCLKNMQGVYHFRAKNEQQAKQFEKSIQIMAQKSLWCKENRFGSFAPIRINTPVAWFVDARDYFWDMSVALENARECIYIHDWWLSPELVKKKKKKKKKKKSIASPSRIVLISLYIISFLEDLQPEILNGG